MKPAAIRVNYGLQRHAGGGMASTTIACLPVSSARGAMRRVGSCSTADFYNLDHKRSSDPISSAASRERSISPRRATR